MHIPLICPMLFIRFPETAEGDRAAHKRYRLFYWKQSETHKGIRRDIQTIFEEKPHKMLHPARWLSLQSLLAKYDPLLIYFQLMSNGPDTDVNARAINSLSLLKSPVTKLFLEFLNYILTITKKLNRLSQSKSPQIQSLHLEVQRLVKTI